MTAMAERSLAPSKKAGITDKQIEKIRDVVVALLYRYRKVFRSADVQVVLGRKDLSKKLVESIGNTLRKLVEEAIDGFVRSVKPNYSRTPQEMLIATGCEVCSKDEAVATMPTDGMRRGNLEFFNLGKYVSDDELELEIIQRGYARLATPYELADVNEKDPTFADLYQNGTHWKDSENRWYFIVFLRLLNERIVTVDRRMILGGGWNNQWWFAGVRKAA
jgi:hypothetical protein